MMIDVYWSSVVTRIEIYIFCNSIQENAIKQGRFDEDRRCLGEMNCIINLIAFASWTSSAFC